MKISNKKFLIGGGEINSNKQIETFLSIIIIGYFGIKIVYGFFFKFYPEKYYYKNIEITSNAGAGNNITDNVTLNAYMPGMWNNEMTDFITLLVLSYVIYIYTNVTSKSFIDANGNLSLSFLFGYIIGLGYPPIYTNYINLYKKEMESSVIIKYIYLIVLVGFIIGVILVNYTSMNEVQSSHKVNYIIYSVVIVLLFFGLILSKKNSSNYSTVTYFDNNGESCSFNKNGVLQTSGDLIHITAPFIVFIILLLFSYEPSETSMKNLYTFVYGLLLGILVSSISYYGIEYFLQKKPQKECKDINECIIKDMPLPIKDEKTNLPTLPNLPNLPTLPDSTNLNNQHLYVNRNLNNGSDSSNGLNRIALIKIVLLIIIILVSIYLIYYYFLF